MHSTNFHYNGFDSEEFGVYMVNLDSGLHQTRFLAERSIISESIPNNPIPYVYGVQYQPLRFTLTLATIDQKWTLEQRRAVARWLDTENFEVFLTDEEPEKLYYFMYQGGIDLNYGGELTGYIQVEMVNISPYAYSPIQTYQVDCSLLDITEFIFPNDSDTPLCPELTINKVGNGNVSIVDVTDTVYGKEFKFTGLVDNETVYIDNQHSHIESDIPLTLRYDSFNHNYLEIPRGYRTLRVTGKCKLEFKYQFIIKG